MTKSQWLYIIGGALLIFLYNEVRASELKTTTIYFNTAYSTDGKELKEHCVISGPKGSVWRDGPCSDWLRPAMRDFTRNHPTEGFMFVINGRELHRI